MEKTDDQWQEQMRKDWIRDHFKDWSEKELLSKAHSLALEIDDLRVHWFYQEELSIFLDRELHKELQEHKDALKLLHGYTDILSPDFYEKAKEAYSEARDKVLDRDELDIDLE